MNKKVYIILIIIELFLSGCSNTNRVISTQINSNENNQDIIATTKSEDFTESTTTTILETESFTETTTEDNYSKYEKEKERYYNEFLKRGYKISPQKFENIDEKIQKNIIVNYPKITGFKNKNIENKANETIKEAVFEEYNEFYSFHEDDKIDPFYGTSWDINYEIVYINKDILGIMFEGYIYTFGCAHGTNVVFTVNINLNTGDKIYINDLFYDNFKEKIAHRFVKGISLNTPTSMDIELQQSINQEYSWCVDNFNNSYNNFTFGDNKLIIIMPIRDYYVFYIEYADLKDCMKENNKLWQGLLKN